VFLTFDGQVKLLDFGIAKAADSMHETNAGVVKGKVSYMSPEQGRGQKVDARADVFSAGVLLWEALTGKRMREGKNEQEKLWALVSEDIPRASAVKPSVPKELDDICARAMAWNRDERYSSAGAMQKDLERYLLGSGTNVTARDVGGCVSELFRDDRVNTNAVIEAHVARARGGQGREQLPIIDVARMGGSMGGNTGNTSPTPSGERMPSSQRSMTSMPGVGPDAGVMTSLDIPSARPGALSSDSLLKSPDMPQMTVERPRRSNLLWISGAAVVVVALAVIVFVATRGGGDPTAKTAQAAARTPEIQPLPAKPAEPAKPARVDVEIRVSPESAIVSIDGRDVDGNPYVGQFSTDDVTHHIRASAPGYVAKSRAVMFNNGNVTLDMSLERVQVEMPAAAQVAPPVPVAPPAPVTPVRQPTHPSAPTRPSAPSIARGNEAAAPSPAPQPVAPEARPSSSEIDPNGGNKPKRPIDMQNPYGGVP
jgi:serine/threonine-protein kinase